MTECPILTELPANPVIITVEQILFLVVDNYSRSVGTTVNVRCQSGVVLIGPSTVRCMQSGYWSSEPYCSYPNQETTSSPTSGMDESLILVIVLSVVGFLVVALILFVCVAMFWGRIHRKKIKKYRDTSDFYVEEVSSQPYSISRKHPEGINMYDRNKSQIPRSYSQDHMRHHRQYEPYPHYRQYESSPHHLEMEEGQHPDDNVNAQDYHYQHNHERRHFRYKCPNCRQRYNTMRHAHSENDILDENQRGHRSEDDDEDKPIRDRRRDGYLWRSRSSFSELNLPRPYYEMSGLPHYVAYYGPNVPAEI